VSVLAERPPSTERVCLDRATVSFDRRPVLLDVSLKIAAGEYVCVRGRNGAGKTTLLRVLAGAIRPSRGTRRGPRACAYIPPTLAPPAMSAAAWLQGVRRDRVDDPHRALATLGFDGDADRTCRELSFGNLRKVLLADAFTSTVSLLAIDEVHVGLDHPGRLGLEQLVVGARTRGAAVLVAAQDDDPVDGVQCTLLVGGGRVREVGTAAPAAEVVRRTLRGPRAAEPELLEVAGRLGFLPDDRDEDQ
jgi:ABC-type Mn2+/Zn2+ transport system ATPase subunit